MIGDPNWLYSTIAQSSAAIVAIIGGFITATILSLVSEKRSLVNQRNGKEAHLKTLIKEEKRLSYEYDKLLVDDFLSRLRDDLKELDILPSFEELLKQYLLARHLNREILEREYNELIKRISKARAFMEQHSNNIDFSNFVTFDDWRKENQLYISDDDYIVFNDEYFNYLKKQREAKEKKDRTSTWSAVLPESFRIIDTQHELYNRELEDRKLQETEGNLQKIKYEISLIRNEIANLREQIEAFSYPPNLGWGLIALGCLAVFGILLPVLILAYEAFYTWAKVFTTVTFWLGIIGVFTYVVFQIRTLRR